MQRRLSGRPPQAERWGFATGSRHASWLGAHVPIFEPDGAPRLNPNGRPFVRTVLFPKSSAEIIDNWQVIGSRGTGSDTYRTSLSHRNTSPYGGRTPRRARSRARAIAKAHSAALVDPGRDRPGPVVKGLDLFWKAAHGETRSGRVVKVNLCGKH
jgi:hypothetical protein